MLAFGRMSPTHPANKFAEGLINPNAGRGANYSSVMKMGFELQGVNIDALRGMENTLSEMSLLNIKSCELAATNYCDTLEANGVTLKDREGTIKCLTDTNIYLQSINNQSEFTPSSERVDIFKTVLYLLLILISTLCLMKSYLPGILQGKCQISDRFFQPCV